MLGALACYVPPTSDDEEQSEIEETDTGEATMEVQTCPIQPGDDPLPILLTRLENDPLKSYPSRPRNHPCPIRSGWWAGEADVENNNAIWKEGDCVKNFGSLEDDISEVEIVENVIDLLLSFL